MYQLQVVSKDYELVLKTEITADTAEEMKSEARKMVSRYPAMVGKKYRIWKLKQNDRGYMVADGAPIKEDVIKG